jgi:hypothetical protein
MVDSSSMHERYCLTSLTDSLRSNLAYLLSFYIKEQIVSFSENNADLNIYQILNNDLVGKAKLGYVKPLSDYNYMSILWIT